MCPTRYKPTYASQFPSTPANAKATERYTNLRATLHSEAFDDLEGAEAKLVADSEGNIRKNRQKLAALEAPVKKLLAPLRDRTVDYTAVGADGRERTAAVSIGDAVAALEQQVEAAEGELERLWAS